MFQLYVLISVRAKLWKKLVTISGHVWQLFYFISVDHHSMIIPGASKSSFSGHLVPSPLTTKPQYCCATSSRKQHWQIRGPNGFINEILWLPATYFEGTLGQRSSNRDPSYNTSGGE